MLLSAFPIWFVVTSCNLLDLLECRLTRASGSSADLLREGVSGQLSWYTHFPTSAPALQTECHHIVEGCMVFVFLFLLVFGCWLLAGVVQLFGIGVHHLFLSWRLTLRSMRVIFSTKKGIFFVCCRSAYGHGSYLLLQSTYIH